MDEFHAALEIERRAPVDAIVPLRGPNAVIEPKAEPGLSVVMAVST
jgi:hypothetical protein